MGQKGNTNKPQRFCKRGHDKHKPHGSYIRTKRDGRVYNACAECLRMRSRGEL